MAAPQSVHDGPDFGRASVRVVGYVSRSVEHGLDCESPLLAVRQHPDGHLESEHWLCSNHRESKCRPCATRYRRRVQAVAAEGLGQLRPKGWREFFVTVTAPSESPHCMKAGCESAPFCRHQLCPCTPWDGIDLAEWNASAGRRWNHLLTLIERHYGTRPAYFRAAEVQDGKRRDDGIGRGALHHHVLVSVPYAIDKKTLRALAIEAGYGHVVDVQVVSRKSNAMAEYVSKYVAKSADRRSDVPWRQQRVDKTTGEVTESTDATFRTWSQSKTWGTTMARIRAEMQELALELKRQRESSRALVTADLHGPGAESSHPDSGGP
jgi:hypothetical protein